MPELPTGTVTFLYTDIEGSTRLVYRLGDAYAGALAEHQRLLRAAFAHWGGQEVDTQGDAFFVTFARAAAAIEAAVEGQRALGRQPWPGGVELRVRMALLTGEPRLAKGAYTGLDVHRVARICGAAHGGQILLAQSTRDLIEGRLGDGLSLHDLGEHRLKDLQRAERIYQLVVDGLPRVFPVLRSLSALPNNLPIQLNSFVGRQAEMAEVKRLLADGRLLTLTGPGGTGKTRLSLQVAADVLEEFPDGVWFIELAPLADASLVTSTVAGVMGVREPAGRALHDALIDALRETTGLLVLDNCEHLVEACAQFAEGVLRACPRLKVMASSREPLGIAGEVSYRVPSLALPQAGAQLTAAVALQSPAVQLFVERAQAAQPSFALTDSNAGAVAQVCRRLDGIPLAIELAAARLRVLSAEQIAARLDDRFRLLTGGSRTALPRHQTLRALIDWSYELLTPGEAALLRRLAVFAGGWTLEAAESVTQTGRADLDVLDGLARLADKSLLVVDEGGREARYRLLETIRQYASEKLIEAGEAAQARDHHLAFFLTLAEQAEPALTGREAETWLDRLEAEHDNLRIAVDWALDTDPLRALELVIRLTQFLSRRGFAGEGRRWAAEALQRTEALPAAATDRVLLRTRALALSSMTALAIGQGDSQSARGAAEESVRLWRALDDNPGQLVDALSLLAFSAHLLGDAATARTAIQEAVDRARTLNDPHALIMAIGNQARIAFEAEHDLAAGQAALEEVIALTRSVGDRMRLSLSLKELGIAERLASDYVSARAHLGESLLLAGQDGDRFMLNVARSELAEVARQQGNLGEAAALFGQCLSEWLALGNQGAVARCLECFGFMARARADRAAGDEKTALLSRMARLCGAAEALRARSGASMIPPERAEYAAEVEAGRAALGDTGWQAAWAEGCRMTAEEARALVTALQKEVGV
jgi:predicted ATPase/class 3 adenylate cyclase